MEGKNPEVDGRMDRWASLEAPNSKRRRDGSSIVLPPFLSLSFVRRLRGRIKDLSFSSRNCPPTPLVARGGGGEMAEASKTSSSSFCPLFHFRKRGRKRNSGEGPFLLPLIQFSSSSHRSISLPSFPPISFFFAPNFEPHLF